MSRRPNEPHAAAGIGRPLARAAGRIPLPSFWLLGLALLLGPSAAAFGRSPHRRRVGYAVTLGGNTFRIWGGAKTGLMPKGCSVSPDGKRLYVTNFGNRNVHNLDIFDAHTLRPIRRMHWAGNAIESVATRDGRHLWVSNFYHDRLHLIDVRHFQILRTLRPGQMPKMLLLSHDEKVLYVANWIGGRVSAVDTHTGRVIARVRTGKYARGLALSPDGRTLYVANTGGRHVVAVDTATMTVRWRVRTGARPRHLAITRDGRWLYASILTGGRLQVIDTRARKVVRTVWVGRMPRTIGLSRDERFVYLAVYADHRMVIVDTQSWKIARLDLDIVKASGLAVHPNDRWIYVTGWCSNDVWRIDRIRPGETPGPLGSPPKRRLYYHRGKVNPYSLGCR